MKPRIRTWIILALITTSAGALPATPDKRVSVSVYKALERAETAVEEERYTDAMAAVREELLKDPSNPYLLYNYGLAAYLARDFKIARDAWGRLRNLEGDNRELGRDLGSMSLFQLGNADLKEAVELENSGNRLDAMILYRRAISFYEIAISMEGRGSSKAATNLAETRRRFVKMLTDIGKEKRRKNEGWFEGITEKYNDPRTLANKLDWLEKEIRETQTFLDEALQVNPEHHEARREKKKMDRLLEDTLLASARAERDQLREYTEKEKYKNTDSKINHAEKVMEKYDRVLDENPDNPAAREEKNEIAKEVAESLHEAAKQDREHAEKWLEKDDTRHAVERLEDAQEKLAEARAFDETNPEIRDAEQQNREELAELKEKRGDELAEYAATQDDNRKRQKDAFRKAIDQYEESAELKNDPSKTLEEKVNAAQKGLAQSHKETGDELTKSSEWMEKFMEMETGEKPSFEDKSEEELQVDISKMERGAKEYEMAGNIDPALEPPAEAARQEALRKLSEMRDALNQKRLAGQPQGTPPPGEQPETDPSREAPEDTDQALSFDDESLRDLQVSREIFRKRNYDTERRKVQRDW